MGQVITSADMRRVVDANLHSYIEQSTGSYARLFGKSPTFVTYYMQNGSESYADVNLGGAIQLLGPESPIRYQVIHDFPIYGMPEADASSAYDELRGVVSGSIRGEVFVLPGTIEPAENDYFVIDYLTTKIVFRNISSNADRIEGKPFFKFEYILDPVDYNLLDRQVSGSYDFELGVIGTGANPLLETDTAILLREMEVLEEFHRVSYWNAFYDRGSGTLLLRTGFDLALHDRAVDLFIQRGDLLGGAGYMKSRNVRPAEYADRGLYDDAVYNRTIYWAAEKGVWTGDGVLGAVMLAPASPASPSSPFFAEFAVTGYIEALPAPDGDYFIGGETFLSEVSVADYGGESKLRSLAKMCLHEGGFDKDQRVAIRAFNALLNDASLLENRLHQFWLMPLVLMRAKRFRDAARANN